VRKSIAFGGRVRSTWTSSKPLAERALTNDNDSNNRIDGKMKRMNDVSVV